MESVTAEEIVDVPVAGLGPETLITLVCAAVIIAVISEVICWYLIFRHDEYKQAVQKVIKEQEVVDNLRDKVVFSAGTMSTNQ